MQNHPALIRTDYVCALLLNHDLTAAEQSLARFERIAHIFPYPAEIETERRYMALARQRVQAQ